MITRPSIRKLLFFRLTGILLALFLVFGITESVLRVVPRLINVALLAQFEPPLSDEIANRLSLPTKKSAVQISSEIRGDGGQTIFLRQASAPTLIKADSVDIEMGAVEKVMMDQNGLKNDPVLAVRSEAKIFIAGDSFIFCPGVSAADTASAQLQVLSGLKVYNLGVAGVGPYEYLEVIKKHAAAFRPSIVIMSIYEGNDLRDVLRTKAFMESKNTKRKAERIPFWTKSYAIQFIRANAKFITRLFNQKVGRDVEPNFRYSALVAGQRVKMNTTNRDLNEVEHALMLKSGQVSLDSFIPPLAAFTEWARKNDVIPIVIYIPSMYTAYAKTVIFEDPDVGEAVKHMSEAQRQWFAANTQHLGLRYLDLTVDFQVAAENGGITHFPANVHPTRKGNEVIARRLFVFLRETNAITTPQSS